MSDTITVTRESRNPKLWRDFSTTEQISQSESHSEEFFPLLQSGEELLEKIGETGAQLIRDIFKIKVNGTRAVAHVKIFSHAIHVRKNSNVDWKKIEKQVISALKKAFGDKAGQVDVVSSEKVEAGV